MRDLANQNFTKNGSSSPKTIRAIILAVLLAGVIWFVASNAPGSSSTSGPVVLHDAPKGLTPVSLPDVIGDTGKTISLKTDSATFKNVSDGPAKATAVRKYGDGTYSLAVEATLPNPEGQRYQVWLVSAAGDIADAGFLNGGGTTWSVVFNDKDYYSADYNKIWITREITSEDNKPEKHILEGRF